MAGDKRHQDNQNPTERSRIGQMGGQASRGKKGGKATNHTHDIGQRDMDSFDREIEGEDTLDTY